MMLVESLCAQSRRASATRTYARATFSLAFSRFLDPFALRDSAFCALWSFFSARRRKRGLSIFRPSESTAKCARPRSIPISVSATGSGSSAVSTTNEAKYRPDASLTMVTLDGSDGRSRDQRTSISPILAKYRRPLGRIEKRPRVNRIACRLSLRDLNRGGSTFGPFRLPATEAKNARYAWYRSLNDCCNTTLCTSANHARSGV